MKIYKRKGFICFIIALITILSITTVTFADGTINCPNCGFYTCEWWYNPEPTCTSNGVIQYECYSCFYANSEVAPLLGHSYNVPYATCTEDKYCTCCGFVYESKLGHLWGWNETYKYYECTRCHEISDIPY